ncbi:MAG: D,D-heptose 1,7-bisphosphate phosphatase [Candidatus Wallbacteria bacterium GWC2_49_35]|uniref:D,D-heptose 1,7-bisphosphate phosphatase n=1 Tax=Candidatus Wallbacteria bacterium GWC2_49_35 TaxID=1817813 RepID=A0A1F7WQF2_9BACT|nr:MAG: D,D-heptose 1,7-bisphosphate phosphatase [Candidatus Wallbacteria bacterium GWC2_49_35]HBC73934.1 D,D-heptose 1,7-bisphosphate phosphatase [Candidatus Wallbacteria bacterium]
MPKIAVFIDRDGTMSEEVGYVNHLSRFKLLENTAAAVKLLNEAGILAIVATNQAGVARGYFEEPMINKVHEKLKNELAKSGASVAAIYYCPHHPSAGKPPYRTECNCRKPKPGMILKAKDDFNIDLTRSYMVGDKISDVEFGLKLGLKSVMVMTGYGIGEYEHQRQDWKVTPDFMAGDLLDAVKWIIEDIRRSSGNLTDKK